MKKRSFKLSSANDAKDFVTITGKCDFDIDLYCNSIVLDAKSLIGVLSLDYTKTLVVAYDGEDEAFEEFLDAHSKSLTAVA